MSRKPFVAGNWKMNTSAGSAVSLATQVAAGAAELAAQVDVAVCPPMIWLQSVVAAVQGRVAVGAQNVSPEPQGAFTGQVSPGMLAEAGCRYVIIGHSETRHTIDRGESPTFLASKVKAVLGANLTPIYCIGETLPQRQAGETDAVNCQQLAEGLTGLTQEDVGRLVVAYEPVWAIGTGLTATNEQAQQAHSVIRGWIRNHFGPVAETVRILYGGSVKSSNAKELFALPDVDGGLIGGASLKSEEFLSIVRAAI